MTSDSGAARDLIQQFLQDPDGYFGRTWPEPAQRYLPIGRSPEPIDDLFEDLAALHPVEGHGAEGDHELALLLQISARELVDAIGGRWQRPRDYRIEDRTRIWYLSGHPMQVIIGIGSEDLVVGTPTLHWTITPVLAMDEEIARLPRKLSPAVTEAATRAQEIRRAQFTYCRTCRSFTAPENGGSNCHGCMQQVGGVAF